MSKEPNGMATFNPSSNIVNNCAKSSEAAFAVSSPSCLIGLNSNFSSAANKNQSYICLQKNGPNPSHQNSSTSFKFTEIKREPCQVSEVTTSNNLHLNNQLNKTVSTTMTSMVKIESTSPKISETGKVMSQINSNDDSVGIPMRKKGFDESFFSTATLHAPKDLGYFGIRVADMGGITTPNGNVYFSGPDPISTSSSEHMDNNSMHNNVTRPSTFWQYPNTFPLESVISMSPMGLQYSRDVGRSQIVLLPAPVESFQPTALLWPSYLQQGSEGTLQPASNYIFPTINPQNTQSQTFGTSLQFFGPNYLSATAAICQHSQSPNHRLIPVLPATRKTEQSQRNCFKSDDWNKYNLISNPATTLKSDKSKVDYDSNYFENQTTLVTTSETLSHQQPHILLHNTQSTHELVNIPAPSSYETLTDTTLITSSQMMQDVDGGVYKNSALRISCFLKTPETQDVNIQTDTLEFSDGENSSSEILPYESVSCTLQHSEKNILSNLSQNQCRKNNIGCKTTLKENCREPFHVNCVENITSEKAETYILKKELSSNTLLNKNECYHSDNTEIISSREYDENGPLKITNPLMQEMSGLELLSNISAGAFENHKSQKKCVKEEPSEPCESKEQNECFTDCQTYASLSKNVDVQCSYSIDNKEMQNNIHSCSEPSLGGLNLLCALAEQRIQEEVANNTYNNMISKQNPDVKTSKHRHSKAQQNKKLHSLKKNKIKNTKQIKKYFEQFGSKTINENVQKNLKGLCQKVDFEHKKSNKWLGPEFFEAMETDMRIRLAEVTRQYKKKKRKLEEINKLKKTKASSEYNFANISCKNPNFICFLDKYRATSSNIYPFTETKTNDNQDFKMQKKKNSEHKARKKQNYKEKSYSFKFNTLNHYDSVLNEKLFCKADTQSPCKAAVGNMSSTTDFQEQTNFTRKDQAVNTKIDKELILSNEHLYQKETRVLTDMGGLFYAGILKPLEPPDVYAITLDGERGNKSHIMSREEIFKDTILEVIPKRIENVPTGTRLCAYWSQQYRCLYPGKAIDCETTERSPDFVSVEFDDGDSGKIRLQNIRFLLSDYPIAEYSENLFNSLGKNKRSTTTKCMSYDASFGFNRPKDKTEIVDLPHVNSADKKQNQLEKNMSNEFLRKTRKHKKKKKGKKHTRKSFFKIENSEVYNDQNRKENKVIETDRQGNFHLVETNINTVTATCDIEADFCLKQKKQSINTLIFEDMNTENTDLETVDLQTNIASDTSDSIKGNEITDHNSGKGSKIAAFLPERQLWGWLGQAYRKTCLKGRSRKQFYKSITRGNEIITVGECAVFLSTGRPDRPYIGRIEAMWETSTSNKVVRVRWFYHPEETIGCPILKYPGALFDSPHEDENDVQTISHRCEVITFSAYINKVGPDINQYQSVYDNNDIYYQSGFYNPRLKVLKLNSDIPIEI